MIERLLKAVLVPGGYLNFNLDGMEKCMEASRTPQLLLLLQFRTGRGNRRRRRNISMFRSALNNSHDQHHAALISVLRARVSSPRKLTSTFMPIPGRRSSVMIMLARDVMPVFEGVKTETAQLVASGQRDLQSNS